MRMIYSQKVTLVPIKEMTDVLSVEKKSVEIDQNTWIRVKTGIYKGDLAKVGPLPAIHVFMITLWSQSCEASVLLWTI
jgi:hypothetical protein